MVLALRGFSACEIVPRAKDIHIELDGEVAWSGRFWIPDAKPRPCRTVQGWLPRRNGSWAMQQYTRDGRSDGPIIEPDRLLRYSFRATGWSPVTEDFAILPA